MEVIRDRGGNVIRRSKNLAGIRRYVGGARPPLIKSLDISTLDRWEGRLSILFEDGTSFETVLPSSNMLNFVSGWRNVYGAPLTFNGQPRGPVSRKAIADLLVMVERRPR